MAETKNTSKDTFTSVVVPIMDKVRSDIQHKLEQEQKQHGQTFSSMMMGGVGPDGGATAAANYDARLRSTGQWTSKTVDDYIAMVKAELKRKGVEVDAVMEKKMIDHLVKQQMPKSTTEYILRKAATGTIFYIPERMQTTSMQDHINKEGEKKHNPSLWEEVAGNILSWAANAASTAGFGGFFGQTAIDAGVAGSEHVAAGQQEKFLAKQRELGTKEVAEAAKKDVAIPKWMLTQMGFNRLADATDEQLAIAAKWASGNADWYRKRVKKALDKGSRTLPANQNSPVMSVGEGTIRCKQYETFAQAIAKEQGKREEEAAEKAIQEAAEYDTAQAQHQATSTENEQKGKEEQASQGASSQETATQNAATSTGNYSGWEQLSSMLGLNGFGDTFQHLGITLATLPDMLVGLFTGRTKSIGLNKNTMMPLAALVSGTFIKNPMLKIPLMLYGGASLVNQVGQEAIAEYRKDSTPAQTTTMRYRQYADEQLNPRITNPHVEGNVLIVDIDHVPRIVTMPPMLADAYQSGAIPLNTLANHILAKSDAMQQNVVKGQQEEASKTYEEQQERTQVRGIR